MFLFLREQKKRFLSNIAVLHKNWKNS